jgi:L-galactose dehydrogenase
MLLFERYYGGTLSEKMLGQGLKALGVPRNEYIVSTKCGRYVEGFDFSAERVTRSIDESLARLQLDYVDILQCHDIEFGSLDQVLNFILFFYLGLQYPRFLALRRF